MSAATEHFCHMVESKRVVETPSSVDGVSYAQEAALRAYGCGLVRSAGMSLSFPQSCISKGQVFLQRLYYVVSLRQIDVVVAAFACLNMASKLDSCDVRLRKVISAFYTLLKGSGSQLDTSSGGYFDLREYLLNAEKRVLKELGFVLQVEPVYSHMLAYCKVIGWGFDQGAVPQAAVAFLNDSCMTTLHCRFPANVISCACIYLALRQCKHPDLPAGWYKLFEVTSADMAACCTSLMLPIEANYVNLNAELPLPPLFT